jgi:hypothetical protein
MAAVATLGTYRKTNFKIGIFVCLALSVWLAYDGYFNQTFIQKNTIDGKANSTVVWNQRLPFLLVPLAGLFAIRWWMVKDKKIVADGKTLVLDNGEQIDYDRIEKIDKKDFEKKGHFIIYYRDAAGKEVTRKLSDRNFNGLENVLAELVNALKGTQNP